MKFPESNYPSAFQSLLTLRLTSPVYIKTDKIGPIKPGLNILSLDQVKIIVCTKDHCVSTAEGRNTPEVGVSKETVGIERRTRENMQDEEWTFETRSEYHEVIEVR